MSCFLVPAAEAIITTTITKVVEKKEFAHSHEEAEHEIVEKEHFSSKLKRLNGFLWGGSALLAFEHLWHGEIQPFFPFLTKAMEGETTEMLHEMSTVGVSMAVAVTAIWGVMTIVTNKIVEREDKAETVKEK